MSWLILYIPLQVQLPISGAACSLILSLSLFPVRFWLVSIQKGEKMKSCCNSLRYVHRAAATETRALSLCWKITKPGAYPSCLWARHGVRGTTNCSHSHPHSYSFITAWNNRRNTVKPVLCREDSPPQTSFHWFNQVCWLHVKAHVRLFPIRGHRTNLGNKR